MKDRVGFRNERWNKIQQIELVIVSKTQLKSSMHVAFEVSKSSIRGKHGSLSSVRFNYKEGYKPCDLL